MQLHKHTWHKPESRLTREDVKEFLTNVFPGYDTVSFVYHQCHEDIDGQPCGAISVFSYYQEGNSNRRIIYSGRCWNCNRAIDETFNNAKFQGLGWPFANTQYGSPFRIMKIVKELEEEFLLDDTDFKMVQPPAGFPHHQNVNIDEFIVAFNNAKNVSTTQEE